MRSATHVAGRRLAAITAFTFLTWAGSAATAFADTRYVRSWGTDTPICGVTTTTPCRSITQAIALAAPGDVISVGAGRYGDLNRNGILGEPGEENGSPGCGCVVSLNKAVSVISYGGAAVTYIDGTTVDTNTTVLIITIGGEFGRPGKGFTVSGTARRGDGFGGHGIVLDASNVMVRGNQVIFSGGPTGATGILTVNFEPLRLEGNLVRGWPVGIESRGAAIVSKNLIMRSAQGVLVYGGTLSGNVVSGNQKGVVLMGPATVALNVVTGNWDVGFDVSSAFSGSISKNNIFGNTKRGYPGIRCGLYNRGVPGLDARNNFWGAASGPNAADADDVCQDKLGPITFYGAWATKPFTVTILKP